VLRTAHLRDQSTPHDRPEAPASLATQWERFGPAGERLPPMGSHDLAQAFAASRNCRSQREHHDRLILEAIVTNRTQQLEAVFTLKFGAGEHRQPTAAHRHGTGGLPRAVNEPRLHRHGPVRCVCQA